jgi:hypothetical protein
LNEKNGYAVFSVRSRERNTTTNMENATDTNPIGAKRIRFVTQKDNGEQAVKTPTVLAESFIRSSVASLQPTLATIIEKLGKEHLVLLGLHDGKKSTLKKMEDNTDFIPRSARIDFKISGSKRAERSAEFITLTEETSTMVDEFRKKLRGQIIKALKIEVNSMEDEMRDHLLKAIRLIAKSFMIVNKNTGDVDFKVNTLMAFFSVSLTKHCPMTLLQFQELYKKVHDLETFPPSAPTGTNPMDNQPDIVPDDIDILNTTLESVFVTTWDNYKEQQAKNTVALELKKLSAGYFTDRDTATAVAAVDLEPAADKPELKALIRKETKAEHLILRQEINNLKQQIVVLKKQPNTVQKNSNARGQGKGASSKINQTKSTEKPSGNHNKNNNKQTDGRNIHNNPTSAVGKKNTVGNQRQQQQRGNNKTNPNRKADGNNNGIGNGKRKWKGNSGKNLSTPNNSESTKRRKQSSTPSKNGQK